MVSEACIDIEDGIDPESTLGFYNHSFIREICDNNFYMNLQDILNEDELDIIMPHVYDEDNRPLISPLLLYNSFKKIYSYLFENKDIVPMYHEIYAPDYFGNFDWRETCEFVDRNNLKYYIDGDIYIFQLSFYRYNKLFPELLEKDYYIKYQKYFNVIVNKMDVLSLVRIKAEPLIKVGSKEFNARSFYKYQQYEKQITDILNICQKASNLNKRIVWRLY